MQWEKFVERKKVPDGKRKSEKNYEKTAARLENVKRRRKESLHEGWTAAKTELPSVNQVASDKDNKKDESKTRDA